jgi:hypothetical protein
MTKFQSNINLDNYYRLNITVKTMQDNPVTDTNQNTNVQGLTEGDLKLIRDLQKRVTELEKSLKLLQSTINADQIYKELSKINEALLTKVNQQDLNRMEDNYSIRYL